MKSIFYATDIHLTDKQPINRITPINPNGLLAFKQLLDVAKDAYLILGGDLFESPCPSYDLFNSVVKSLKTHHGEVFTVFGNHDILYADTKAENNALAALVNMGLIKELTKEPVQLSGFDVYGISYVKEIYKDFNSAGLVIKNPENSIVVTHQYMSNIKLPYNHIHIEDFNAENCWLVLCGHLHTPFKAEANKTMFLNTGCVCKLNRNEANFGTSYAEIKADKTVKVHKLKNESDVQFVQKQVSTADFIKSVADVKLEKQDVLSYIESSDAADDVKKEAIRLINEYETAN